MALVDQAGGAAGASRGATGAYLLHPISLFVLVGVAYFVTAQIGLKLLMQPEQIAVFWPASGIAAGAVIALGRTSYLPVGAAVALATLAANWWSRSDPRLGAVFAVCNAIECLTAATILRALHGETFDLNTVRRVVSFVLAAFFGTALAAMPAAFALKLIAESPSTLLRLWYVWFEADFIGLFAIAPVLIAAPGFCRDQHTRAGVAEGALLLVALAVASYMVFGGFAARSVGRHVPLVTVVFPLLLWISARCCPAFAAAGAAVVAGLIVDCTIKGFGPLHAGEGTVNDRADAAQLIVLITTFCALSLAALFAERRQAEQYLQMLRTTLEQRVAERTRDLQQSNARLARETEDRIDAINKLEVYRSELAHMTRVATAGELASFIAHELNQPLQSISTTAAACRRLDEAGRLEPGELAVHLNDISSEAKRASEIIRQLRSLVRKSPPRQGIVDLATAVQTSVSLMQPMATRLGIKLVTEVNGPLPPIRGSDVQIGQLCINLIRNAMDAVAMQQPDLKTITIRLRAGEPDTALLEVIDQGPPIDAAVLARMREPFFSTKEEGLGMGVSIAETIAEAHHAKLVFQPQGEPGHGMTARVVFTVTTQTADGDA